jgi:hypothetical protein
MSLIRIAPSRLCEHVKKNVLIVFSKEVEIINSNLPSFFVRTCVKNKKKKKKNLIVIGNIQGAAAWKLKPQMGW